MTDQSCAKFSVGEIVKFGHADIGIVKNVQEELDVILGYYTGIQWYHVWVDDAHGGYLMAAMEGELSND